MSGRYLVDTNVILWSWHEPHRLPKRFVDILNSDGEFYASVASIWEICIKVAIGKLRTVDSPSEALIATGYQIVPIEISHAEAVAKLPLHHREPFDRLLIAQAQALDLTLLATDAWVRAYGGVKLA